MNNNLFSNLKNTLKMVEGAYKKLKSDFHYDRRMLFVKKRIAVLESDRELFSTTLTKIAENLTNQNSEYFKDLISQIDFKILPKKFISISPQKTTPKYNKKSKVIQSSTDNKQTISKVIFFIDMPIELFIIDYLWTILLGKIANETANTFKYAAAPKLRRSLYNSKSDLYHGTDFESNRAFEHYFPLYKQWRKGAFDKIKKAETDTLLICLDLKNFYNSVEFNFTMIDNYLDNDNRLPSVAFLKKIIEKIYLKYTKTISKQKRWVMDNKNTCLFPIGIRSANLLRELYLQDFDKMIVNKLQPIHYSRYVDDIFILVSSKEEDVQYNEYIIHKYLVSTSILEKKNNKTLCFTDYNNLHIQEEKINCILFLKNKKHDFLAIYESVIKKNSSEWNLLPDIDILNSSFTTNAYNIKNLELSDKIRDLGFLQNDNARAMKFMSELRQLIKNITINSKEMSKYLDQIEEFYSGSKSVEFSHSWSSIFELFLLCKDKDRANKFYRSIKNEINNLSFLQLETGEVLNRNKKYLLKHLENDLYDNLNTTMALVASLNYNFTTKDEIIPLAKQIRESNLLNHNMVSYPLLNYSSVNNIILTETNISTLFKNEKENKIFELDKFKLNWSPRFIHPIEFCMANFIYFFHDNKKIFSNPNSMLKKHNTYNHLNNFDNNLISFGEMGTKNEVVHRSIYIKNSSGSDPKIALVNTKIEEKDVLENLYSPEKYLTHENKLKLFKILNTAKTEKVGILVFPEFYFPIAWLMDIAKFAIKNNITIITGLQYLTFKKRAFNYVCTVHPARSGKSFMTGFLQFREKNFYAPKEKIELSKNKYSCLDSKIPIYDIIENWRYRYSIILCYEFVDITSRASMKSRIDILFVPQLNRDTNYFSAIVESSSRDLYCFVVQANTSSYGDSRITAPYRSIDKNIVQIKGGDTDVVMISQLEMNDLITSRDDYTDKLKRNITACIECTKTDIDKCKGCGFAIENGKLKGTPPNLVLSPFTIERIN